jgi:hypothetical protein
MPTRREENGKQQNGDHDVYPVRAASDGLVHVIWSG